MSDQQRTIYGMSLQDIPKRYRETFRKAYETRSRKASVRAFCLLCVGLSEAEVRECTDKDCPLHKWRQTG